jgi:AcrR family transcriptional regulator
MAPAEECARRAPGRPRSESCRSAIMDATADLLEEAPYSKLTIESIAARAGVSKQTIYKWWKSRAHLAMHAYAARQGTRIPVPDTGDTRADLLAVYRHTCRLLRGRRYRQTIAGLIAEAQTDPELYAEFRETYIGTRRALVVSLLEKGVARGQLREGLDLPFVVDALYGPLWYRLLLRNAPLDDAFAIGMVDHTLSAIATRK